MQKTEKYNNVVIYASQIILGKALIIMQCSKQPVTILVVLMSYMVDHFATSFTE